MKKLSCWNCEKPLTINSISFRASCDHCFHDQHVCLNCKYHSPSKPNSCELLNTENVKEKDKRNFCEDFSIKVDSNNKEKDFTKIKKLFGDDLPTKKIFEDLFKK